MLVDEVEVLVGEHQADIDLGVVGKEIRDNWENVEAAEEDGRRHDQFAARRVEFACGEALRLVDVIENAASRRYILRADVGQRHLPGRADEEPRAEVALQLVDFAADRGERHAESAARGGETSAVCHAEQD